MKKTVVFRHFIPHINPEKLIAGPLFRGGNEREGGAQPPAPFWINNSAGKHHHHHLLRSTGKRYIIVRGLMLTYSFITMLITGGTIILQPLCD